LAAATTTTTIAVAAAAAAAAATATALSINRSFSQKSGQDLDVTIEGPESDLLAALRRMATRRLRSKERLGKTFEAVVSKLSDFNAMTLASVTWCSAELRRERKPIIAGPFTEC